MEHSQRALRVETSKYKGFHRSVVFCSVTQGPPTGKAPQQGDASPVHHRPLALGHPGLREVVEGALPPTGCPPERRDRSLARCGVAEWMPRGEPRPGCASPGIVTRVLSQMGDAHLFMTFLPAYKLREIERPTLSMGDRKAEDKRQVGRGS